MHVPVPSLLPLFLTQQLTALISTALHIRSNGRPARLKQTEINKLKYINAFGRLPRKAGGVLSAFI